MLLAVHIYYDIRGLRFDGKKRTHRFYTETVQMELAEVSAVDAPVAAAWTTALTVDKGSHNGHEFLIRFAAAPPDGCQHTRWHDGSHWVRCLEADHPARSLRRIGPDIDYLVGSPPMTVDSLAVFAASDADSVLLDRTAGFRRPTAISGGEPVEGLYRDIEVNNRQATIDRIARHLAGCVAVDGVVYRRCIEPVLVFRRDRDGLGERLYPFVTVDEIAVHDSIREGSPVHLLSDFDLAAADAAYLANPDTEHPARATEQPYYLDGTITGNDLTCARVAVPLSDLARLADQCVRYGEHNVTVEMEESLGRIEAAVALCYSGSEEGLSAAEVAYPLFSERWAATLGAETLFAAAEAALDGIADRRIPVDMPGRSVLPGI